jgi:hypothetical protein
MHAGKRTHRHDGDPFWVCLRKSAGCAPGCLGMFRTTFGIVRTHFSLNPFMLRIGPFGRSKWRRATHGNRSGTDTLDVSAAVRKITIFSLFLAFFVNVQSRFHGCFYGVSNQFS